MQNNMNDAFDNTLAPQPERPQFLKVLCILSFIGCGLMILLSLMLTAMLGLNEEAINKAWEQVVVSQPTLEDVDPMEFFHAVGVYGIYALIANIISLVGVILMWRLNKFGFFIYAISEIAMNFFSLDIKMGGQEKGYGGMIFWLVIDLAFIVMYAVNLKYMNKKVVEIPRQ